MDASTTPLPTITDVSRYGWMELDVAAPTTTQDGNIQKYIGTTIPIPQTTEDDRGYDVFARVPLYSLMLQTRIVIRMIFLERITI